VAYPWRQSARVEIRSPDATVQWEHLGTEQSPQLNALATYPATHLQVEQTIIRTANVPLVTTALPDSRRECPVFLRTDLPRRPRDRLTVATTDISLRRNICPSPSAFKRRRIASVVDDTLRPAIRRKAATIAAQRKQTLNKLADVSHASVGSQSSVWLRQRCLPIIDGDSRTGRTGRRAH